MIQLDHGWQRGDVCGDWVPNERFAHGLGWLAEQLRSRYGMKLGLWIAPTKVAFTSQLFREHPKWMIQGAGGKPASTGRWFWVPSPEMTMLDAAHPAAEKWIAGTFSRLSADGASYYKIDFIAGSPSLRRAMEAMDSPPLPSAGLASSSYIGDDTGDAGLDGKVFVYVPNNGSIELAKCDENLWVQTIRFKDADLDWSITFDRKQP